MVSKVTTIVVILFVAVAGTGLTFAYHDGLLTSKNSKQTIPPVNSTPSNNTTSSKSNSSANNTSNNTSNNTTSNSQIPDNVFVNQVQTYFTISDSQGIYANFTEQFSGFKMMAGNATQVNVSIVNNNFFNITLNRIEIQSNGFDLENATPLLPTSLNSNSSKNFTLKIFAQTGMKSFNGSIQVDVLGSRTTSVSVSNVSIDEIVNDTLNSSKPHQTVRLVGFNSISGLTSEYHFTAYNNYTYAINITKISTQTQGFSISSTDPQLPIVIMPNESKTFTLNITISETVAGYHSGITMKMNSTSTEKVDITSIKPYLESIDFYGVPTIFGTIGSSAQAGGNFTIQIALMEYSGDCSVISGFKSSTSGFTVISAYPFGGTLPISMSNEEIWFIINIHVSNNMAGYSGALSIGINDNQC